MSENQKLEDYYSVYNKWSNGDCEFHAGRWDNLEDAIRWIDKQPRSYPLVIVRTIKEIVIDARTQ